ncbi:putative acetylxylan esterase precursor [Panaeolus papilionaceus]|nr:putative acetylxylan esterase precursor [Panaeolus papilionaceus]
MRTKSTLLALTTVITTAFAQSCPGVHVFGARETTVSPGYGTAGVVVNLVLGAYPGSTAEAISYPACGGQSSCGGVSYANSVQQGVRAVASAVNSFNTRCPNTQLVLVGYSQGGQIFDDAFCGGGDSNEGISDTSIPIQASAVNMIKAAIFMGDPRHIPGLSYNVGTCNANGFAPRPSGFKCPSASKIQSYCDAADPYCCNGNDANTHQGYGNKYGQAALTFIKSKLSASGGGGGGGGSTTTQPQPTGGGGGTNCAAKYGQCGGQGWTGPTCCQSGSTCQAANAFYSQCL